MFFMLVLLLATPADEIRFQADSCSYRKAMSEAVCTGRVRVRRGDARLSCATLTVRFDPAGKIMQLDCLGAVRFRRGDEEKATGDTARYRRDGQTVVLKGNAEVTRGHTRLAGDRVVFLLDRDEVRVEGSARGSWAGGGD